MIAPRSRRHASPARLFAGVALVAMLAACGGGDGKDSVPADANPAMRATDTPSPALVPTDEAPRDSREVSGKGFSLSAPASFQRSTATSSNGEPAVVLRRTSSVPQRPMSIVVLREVKPKQDVVEQSYALELLKKNIAGAKVSRSDVDWPNSRRAVLVQWTEGEAIEGRRVPVRYWQLSVQTDGVIFAVVGSAPEADFQRSDIAESMATFRPSGGLA